MKTTQVIDTNNTKKDNVIASFQGLRGYAILLIFLSHCEHLVINQNGENAFRYLGGLGVSIFIFISGYLALHKYNNCDLPKPFDLLKRKLLKFYPLHIITLVIALPFAIKSFSFKSVLNLVANIFLVQDWIPIKSVYFSYNAVSWYLSLEVFFILLTPFLVKYVNRYSKKTAVAYIIVVPIFQAAYCIAVQNLSIAHWLIYILPVVRSIDLLYGAFVFKIIKEITFNRKICNYTLLFSLLIILIISALSFNSDNLLFLVAVWTLPVGMLLHSLASGDKTSSIIRILFENRVVVFIGNISFEFFLIHQLVIRYLTAILPELFPGWSAIIYILIYVLSLIFSIIASWLAHKYIKPFKNILKRNKENGV